MVHPAPDFSRILLELAARKVQFMIIGGVGAAMQGAPITTSIPSVTVGVLHAAPCVAQAPRL